MAKGSKSSGIKNIEPKEASDNQALKHKDATQDERTIVTEESNNKAKDEVATAALESADTKPTAESDIDRVGVDMPSIPLKAKEAEDDEPSLSEIIVSRYEGDRSNSGQYEGQGQVWFIGGNTYKGYFMEGVMHGKGKYTWNDEMQYEGDMSNNQISGYGRYEWPDKSYYEGEVANGVRHGVGVFKSPAFNVSYSGQWYFGKRHGRGIMHYSEHSWYEGDWVNNARHGCGVRRYQTGNVYEGQWENDKRHGEGTMRWLTADESFSGMWEYGVQNGCGTHTWYLNRVPGSQYPLRNEYVGDFINGLRHGIGKFFFASGAVYNGEWENNKKHGWGKFIFKNGRVFEGQFENDHMVDHPEYTLDGNENPETEIERKQSPFGWDEADNDMSKDGSGNLLGPSLTLDIDSVLEDFDESNREEELKQVTFLMLRNVSVLRRVYSFYSALGHDRSPDNTFVMTRFQFWRFLKDCRIHHHKYSLTAMDRVITKCHNVADIHNPMEKLLLREFLTSCVMLSYMIYKKETYLRSLASASKEMPRSSSEGSTFSVYIGQSMLKTDWVFQSEDKYSFHESASWRNYSDSTKKPAVLAWCLQRMIEEHILKYSCRVGGNFLSEPRRAVNALAYMDRSWNIYQRACTPRHEPPYEPVFCMRQFLFLLKDLQIISPQLSTKAVLTILSSDDPSVSDGDSCNLEVEMTFLEFFESLIGIAVNFVSDSVQTSFISDHPQDRLSRPASSATQTASEPGATNQALSTDSFSQADDDRGDGAQQQASKQSVASNTGAGSTGAFLQTLSQMSIQDDGTQAADENALSPHEVAQSHPDLEEGSPRENEFNAWCSKLNKFFSHHFFPSWNGLQTLRTETAKYTAETKERQRLKSVELEALRRRQMRSQDPPEEPEPEVTPTSASVECNPVINDIQIVETSEPPRAASSTASIPSSKSGKFKKKK